MLLVLLDDDDVYWEDVVVVYWEDVVVSWEEDDDDDGDDGKHPKLFSIFSITCLNPSENNNGPKGSPCLTPSELIIMILDLGTMSGVGEP